MYENCDYTDTVDPRVHIELERLNNATDEINRLEVDLDEARASFRQLLCDSTGRVDALRLKLGLCVERAKPYYEARFCANEALKQTQIAAMRYERANSAHSAAREMVYLAEQGLGGRTLDPAWQEMLNHATQRVNEAEKERSIAGTEHRIACVKHEASNAKVQSLQKELKRAIAKSSLSIRRAFLTMSSIACQHELLMLPYYEMKAHFNNLLEQQKSKVQKLESQVSTAKLTYAEALRNLEQISDEIHQIRNNSLKAKESASSGSSLFNTNINIHEPLADLPVEEYKSLPKQISSPGRSPLHLNMQEVEGYKNVNINSKNCVSPLSTTSSSQLNELSDQSEKIIHPCVAHSCSSEWTEINLDVSSPEDDIPYKQLGEKGEGDGGEDKRKLHKQKTLPNPLIENEFSSIKSKMKLDTSISNWISRSSAKNHGDPVQCSRRQSLDNILGPTGEKVKEIFSQGMMMLNISSLTERRNSEPKIVEGKNTKKLPSPLEKTLTYLTAEDDISDTESLSSVDMLTEDQINCLMLDKEIGVVCEQLLGTPINEVVTLPQDPLPITNSTNTNSNTNPLALANTNTNTNLNMPATVTVPVSVTNTTTTSTSSST